MFSYEKKGELEEGRKCIESIFCEPEQLIKYIDSEEVTQKFPSIAPRLELLDREHSLLMQQAHDLRDDTKSFIDK